MAICAVRARTISEAAAIASMLEEHGATVISIQGGAQHYIWYRENFDAEARGVVDAKLLDIYAARL